MAVWISRVYLRWFRAFNISGNEPSDGKKRPWNAFKEESFPFVEIPISSRICTVVGANETGKSQLLSAVEKVLRGRTSLGSDYSPHDICRYCGLLSAQEHLWPEMGLEFTFGSANELANCASSLGLTGGTTGDHRIRVFVRGGETDYARFYDAAGEPIGKLTVGDWHTKAKALPSAHFIHSNMSFSNQIHINQLIAQYEDKSVRAYEPVQLQTLAAQVVQFDVEKVVQEATDPEKANKPKPILQSLKTLQASIESNAFQTGDGGLECILFEDILKVPISILKSIRDLNSRESGFVEQLLDDINHRLSETLDVSEYWQQDEDFTLLIEYKAGFFYFFIRDRTGAKYTFDERSGGLKYFLSYYVQAKAIRDAMSAAGAIILMDEPDGFLAAAGQRNLLSVFELLAAPVNVGTTTKRAQVIYTTHSPFLINRNYPDRISLVRKGDGGEGTQHVELVSTRQYEPVRSGLGIEAAETLFMGTENILLEGISEQRMLVAAIQRFGNAERIDDMLDLNRVTIVSASGVWDVPRLLRASKRSKEKRPVTAVFLDGDGPGMKVKEEIIGESLISRSLVGTISDIEVSSGAWCAQPKTLEDLVPPSLLVFAVERFAKQRWNMDQYDHANLMTKWNETASVSSGERLVTLTRHASGGLAAEVDELSLKSGVFEALARVLVDGNSGLHRFETELKQLEQVYREICKQLVNMLKQARTESRQDHLLKSVRLEVERYKKIHGKTASKADVRRCLARLESLAFGADEKSRKARENLRRLEDIVNQEVAHAGFSVDSTKWAERFEKLLQCPWSDLKE